MSYLSSVLSFVLLFFVVHGYLYSRSDQVSEIYSREGHLDTTEAPWYPDPNERYGSYCPEGTWAIGIQFKSHSNQGLFGDDTAGNAVRLKCSSPTNWNSNTHLVETNSPKTWGSWSSKQCPTSGTFLRSFKTQVESNQGGAADDTTLNCVEFQCSNAITIKPTNCRTWGSWGSSWASCPSGSYICGLTEQFEPRETIDDETGLNAVRFYCCGFTASPTSRPTPRPTPRPTARPTPRPTARPTSSPTLRPTAAPTMRPTISPTAIPTASPTNMPSLIPTNTPTHHPTHVPSIGPTRVPSENPTERPTAEPSTVPTTSPSNNPENQDGSGSVRYVESQHSNDLLITLIAVVIGLICLLILAGLFYLVCLRKMVKEVRNANVAQDNDIGVEQLIAEEGPTTQSGTQFDILTPTGHVTGTAKNVTALTAEGEYGGFTQLEDDDVVPRTLPGDESVVPILN